MNNCKYRKNEIVRGNVMKNRSLLVTLFLCIVVSSVFAYGQYGGIPNEYYSEYSDGVAGYAGAKYCGTTKNLTIDEVHNDRWNDAYNDKNCSNLQSFSGKLSKKERALLWCALNEYDYAAGEIYAVNYTLEGYSGHHYALTVQIESDGSITWKGFTYDDYRPYTGTK